MSGKQHVQKPETQQIADYVMNSLILELFPNRELKLDKANKVLQKSNQNWPIDWRRTYKRMLKIGIFEAISVKFAFVPVDTHTFEWGNKRQS